MAMSMKKNQGLDFTVRRRPVKRRKSSKAGCDFMAIFTMSRILLKEDTTNEDFG